MIHGGLFVLMAVVFASLTHPASAAPPDSDERLQELTFSRQIKPLLESKCVRCHGPKKQEAELNLSTPAGIRRGSESGPIIAAGKPDESLLYEMVRDRHMPPENEGTLTSTEIELIRDWIASGARFANKSDEVAAQITEHDVVPIMLLRCTVCHGARRREGELDLRTRESMLRGGKSGPAIVLGRPEESLLVKRVHAGEMPPRQSLVEVSVKPMQADELARLEQWIALDAPEVPLIRESVTAISEEDRQFWSFRPPRAVAVPTVRAADQVRNPIDAFILRKLEEHGLTLSPPADRATLIRRAYVDLIGLPPDSDDVRRFVNDPSPHAYDALIDRLLASPHYGERWGGYWLDLAGYSDSEGVQHSDPIRPHAYRYRDYVIRAFNADKPYNRFLAEQIAGDELADYRGAKEIDQTIYENLVATGFLRMATDGTFSNITGFVPDRLEVIDDEIEVLGSAVLGLTIKCARCHSHKFDPISQADYYRLVAVFKGALDEHDWLKPQRQSGAAGESDRLLPFVTTTERTAWEAQKAKIEEQIAALEKTGGQEEQIKQLKAQLPPEPLIRALWDRGQPSPTYILQRGNYLTPGESVSPGVPAALSSDENPFDIKPPSADAQSTGRRLALARWLTHEKHPLTARVMVNRIWKHHFGRGIAETLDNFGRAGARPSHPDLLDWLAVEFVRSGWSVKELHRLIMLSATYRQSSVVLSEHERLDPDNRLLSRMPLRRLDAEALHDTLLSIAGRLDPTPFGPADPVEARADGLVSATAKSQGWRRSIFILKRRTESLSILDSFDRPQMTPNCIERTTSTVAPQALHLMNNKTIRELAESFAQRLMDEVGDDAEQLINRMYLTALSRPPTADELAVSLRALATLKEQWKQQLTAGDGADAAATESESRRRALVNLCHAMINSAALLYVD